MVLRKPQMLRRGLSFLSVVFYNIFSPGKSITVEGKMRNRESDRHMPHAGCCAADFMCFSSTSNNGILCWGYCPHFIGEEMER